MDKSNEIAVFPLKSILFPRGRLALQIFERRYIDLVRDSLRNDTGFGICLLKSGEEVVKPGSDQTIHRTGTYCRIVDWNPLDNGLLSVTVEGCRKFHVDQCRQTDSGLLIATVRFSEDDSTGADKIPLHREFDNLAELLRSLEDHPLVEKMQLNIEYDNLRDLGWRLSELIPISMQEKQKLLELDDPWERIHRIEAVVAELANQA
ncbi:MAG: LON peptidase substrate-binding domain-containing protein [Pseudohongiellaceae bacterium]